MKQLIITEKELAMRCAADFCAHLDLTLVVEGRYRTDIPDVTFEGRPADIHYELIFENLKAVRLSYDIAFEDMVKPFGKVDPAQRLALGWINRFIAMSEYRLEEVIEETEEEPYHYLAS